eukprot:m.1637960 g.1637960  ORF g.1637960 m.1637960 type:complete len:498 (-) comp26480_c0_seq1:54-1547(-)
MSIRIINRIILMCMSATFVSAAVAEAYTDVNGSVDIRVKDVGLTFADIVGSAHDKILAGLSINEFVGPVVDLQSMGHEYHRSWMRIPRRDTQFFASHLPDANSTVRLIDMFLKAARHDHNPALVQILDVNTRQTTSQPRIENMNFVVDTTKASTALMEELLHRNFSIKLSCEELANTSVVFGIDAVTREFESATNRYTTQHFYVSGPSSQALPAHADPYDVVVLQLGGKKRWKLCTSHQHDEFMNTGNATGYQSAVGMYPPWECHEDTQYSCSIHDVTKMKCTDIVISAGDTLYIPRGVVHMAQTDQQSSLHLTIGIQNVKLEDGSSRSGLRSQARARIRRECSSRNGGSSCDRECACLECTYGCDAACDTCPGTGSGSFGVATTSSCNSAYRSACSSWTQSQSCNSGDYYVQYCTSCFQMCGSDGGLSGGDKAGIVIGTFVLIGIIVVAIVLVIRNQNSGENAASRTVTRPPAQVVTARNPQPPRPQPPKYNEACV